MLESEVKPMPLCLPFFNVSWKIEAGFYFRPGEITLWTGATGNGKSTFLNFLIMNLACSGRFTFIASMEVKAASLAARVFRSTWG